MQKTVLLLVLLISVTGINCHRPGPTSAVTKKKLTIAVIPKGTTHEFWKSIHAGSNKAAAELTAQGTEVDIIWKGPLREDDREQQIQVVEGFVSQGVDGIVLAPLDNHALARPVEEAKRAAVPTDIDSASSRIRSPASWPLITLREEA
jgi:ribose transport system substrate-binding protein